MKSGWKIATGFDTCYCYVKTPAGVFYLWADNTIHTAREFYPGCAGYFKNKKAARKCIKKFR